MFKWNFSKFPKEKDIYNASSETGTRVYKTVFEGVNKLFNRAWALTKSRSDDVKKINEYTKMITTGAKAIKFISDHLDDIHRLFNK